MQPYLPRILMGLGLVMLLVSSMSVIDYLPARQGPTPPGQAVRPDRQQQALVIRQIAHEYLRAVGDSNTAIPPVVIKDDGEYWLPLARQIDYDCLIEAIEDVIGRLGEGAPDAYTLGLFDCTTHELFLGFLSTTVDGSSPACTDRDGGDRCTNVSLTLLYAPEPGRRFPFWALGLCLLIGGLLFRRTPGVAAAQETDDRKTTAYTLGQRTVFSPDVPSLAIDGKSQPLTHREAQVLSVFAEHPNEVVERTDLQSAVWGAEGLITGRSLDVFVSRLRKKLRPAGDLEIQTVHGRGYRLRVR